MAVPNNTQTHSVLAFYYFTEIADPAEEVVRQKAFLHGRDVRARIYISHRGINGQMSASEEAAYEYMAWMHADTRYAAVDFKLHGYHKHVFPRCTVKMRGQLVAMDVDVDPREGGVHLSPKAWREMLEMRDEHTLLLDVRNEYEWKLGHFEHAELPPLQTFREFPQYAKQLRAEKDPERTKIMMYCTGGIRCELYSALVKQEGFSHVFQLEGGVIQYGMQEGARHWQGKLFVFDERLSVSISEDDALVIGVCHHCGMAAEEYYNCANVDCNALFLACHTCVTNHRRCCQQNCKQAPRVRPVGLVR